MAGYDCYLRATSGAVTGYERLDLPDDGAAIAWARHLVAGCRAARCEVWECDRLVHGGLVSTADPAEMTSARAAPARHLLVLDRDPAIRGFVGRVLETEGACRVSGAASTSEAMTVLRHDRPQGAVIGAPKRRALVGSVAGTALRLGVPVLMMVADRRGAAALSGIGITFLTRPPAIDVLIAEAARLLRQGEETHAQAAAQMARLRTGVAEMKALAERAAQHLAHLRRRLNGD
jgi:CheY-like chemotaxis protein